MGNTELQPVREDEAGDMAEEIRQELESLLLPGPITITGTYPPEWQGYFVMATLAGQKPQLSIQADGKIVWLANVDETKFTKATTRYVPAATRDFPNPVERPVGSGMMYTIYITKKGVLPGRRGNTYGLHVEEQRLTYTLGTVTMSTAPALANGFIESVTNGVYTVKNAQGQIRMSLDASTNIAPGATGSSTVETTAANGSVQVWQISYTVDAVPGPNNALNVIFSRTLLSATPAAAPRTQETPTVVQPSQKVEISGTSYDSSVTILGNDVYVTLRDTQSQSLQINRLGTIQDFQKAGTYTIETGMTQDGKTVPIWVNITKSTDGKTFTITSIEKKPVAEVTEKPTFKSVKIESNELTDVTIATYDRLVDGTKLVILEKVVDQGDTMVVAVNGIIDLSQQSALLDTTAGGEYTTPTPIEFSNKRKANVTVVDDGTGLRINLTAVKK